MIRIAVIDDHPIVRAGLKSFLSKEPEIVVLPESPTTNIRELVEHGNVDLLVLELNLGSRSGLEILTLIRARSRLLPVLVFTDYPSASYADTALRLGANAYLHKGCELPAIWETIRRLCEKPPRKAAIPKAPGRRQPDNASAVPLPHERLSPRELQILLRLAKGEAIGRIAESLCLTAGTVSVYRSQMTKKMQLHTNAELTGYALRNGLL